MSDGQPTLFALSPPVWASDPIGERWWDLHRARPEIGAEFVRLAREWRAHRPSSRLGAKAIVEIMRWQHDLGQSPLPQTGDPFRINNNYPALWARWASETYPDLRDAFELRERKALTA